MDTTTQNWSPPTSTREPTSWWPFGQNRETSSRYSPASVETGGVEISHLGGYAMVIALMAGCMLLSAWSRIDLRETAVALDRSERAYTSALAERSRLQLELATLEDPAWLAYAANQLSLDTTVPVVDLSTPPKK